MNTFCFKIFKYRFFQFVGPRVLRLPFPRWMKANVTGISREFRPHHPIGPTTPHPFTKLFPCKNHSVSCIAWAAGKSIEL